MLIVSLFRLVSLIRTKSVRNLSALIMSINKASIFACGKILLGALLLFLQPAKKNEKMYKIEAQVATMYVCMTRDTIKSVGCIITI